MTDSYKEISKNSLIANRYQLKKLIGKGGMGRVYQADDTLLGSVSVAIKFVSQSALDEKMQQAFASEARLCAVLGSNSLHIVRVMDYGIHKGEEPYYVMEYLQGKSLKSLLEVKALSLPDFVLLTRQICIGLQCAHDGIEVGGKVYPVIHRDIKPANIFVSPDESLGQLAKILDFGIAKFFSDHTCMTQTNSYIGTLAYSSPEQIEGGDLDLRSDIYSMGVMMFEMLTKKLPWDLSTPSFGAWYKAHHYEKPRRLTEVNPRIQLPKNIEELVMGCLAKAPGDRPSSMNEIIRTLESSQPAFGPVKAYKFNNESTHNYSISKDENTTYKNSTQDANRTVLQTETEVNKEYTVQVSKTNLKPLIEKACWQSLWPSNKPISQIVFPSYVESEEERLPSLWVMLPNQEIKKYLKSICYNQFLFSLSPHPMILWITAIYNSQYGFRWMPCYLDLKTTTGNSIAHMLGEIGYYPLLFFSLEKPNSCVFLRTSRIASSQCQVLQTWADNSKSYTSTADPSVSKQILKLEYEKIKPRISKKLESAALGENLTLESDANLSLWQTQQNYATLNWVD